MKKPLLLSSSLLAGLALCLASAPASAQDSTPPPPPATSPPSNAAPVTSVGGGAIGIGAVTFLDPVGIGGGQFVYDAAMFHIEAVLGYTHVSNTGVATTDFDFGVAGWYHLARGTNADFSIGGGVGLRYTPVGGGNNQTLYSLDPGVEARVFLTPNFALTGRVGFAIAFGDNNANTVFTLGGQGANEFGFVYFFR